MLARIESLVKGKQEDPLVEGLLTASGTGKPDDGQAGFQKGCLFIDTENAKVYINEGTLASCDFKEVQTA